TKAGGWITWSSARTCKRTVRQRGDWAPTRTGFAVGHAAEVAAPLPWPNRQAALLRNQELQRIWEQRRQSDGEPPGQNGRERNGEVGNSRAEPGAAPDPARGIASPDWQLSGAAGG